MAARLFLGGDDRIALLLGDSLFGRIDGQDIHSSHALVPGWASTGPGFLRQVTLAEELTWSRGRSRSSGESR
jgi:hypothetical protein